ncbi:MAG: chain length determinant protein EpsF [Pseudomonadota bacterium]|nr:chain length determinant protein EpsF [Pseudomonadota bacterium]
MSLKQFILVLLARWKIAAGIFLAVVAAGILYTLFATNLWTSSATVVVDQKADPVAGVVYQTQLQSGYIATQVDVINSERVAERVVKILKLDQSPEFIERWREATGGKTDLVVWLGRMLQKTLSVTPSRDSSVIEIAVEWTDPKTAAVLANAFAQAYVDVTIQLKVDTAKHYAAYFTDQSQQLRGDLQAAQRRLSDFQSATGIVATDGRLDIENARLAELSTQLVTIQALRQDSQSRQHQSGGDNESLPEVLQSPLVASLKGDLSRQEAKLQDIATTLGKNHPDYQTTAAEILSLRQRIASESAKIATSLGNTTQVNLRRENEIRLALEAQKKRILELQRQRDQASVFQNDVVTAQRNLDAVSQRLAQSSLESQTQQTNIALLTPAVEPEKRSSPRLLLNLAISMFLGFVGGIAGALLKELSDRRVREVVDLGALSGVPLLVNIPRIKPSGRSERSVSPMLGRVEPSAI